MYEFDIKIINSINFMILDYPQNKKLKRLNVFSPKQNFPESRNCWEQFI